MNHAQAQPLSPTLTLRQASGIAWEAIVVGAGPAGSVVAFRLARLGLVTLLVDRVTLPRAKVCGCCLAPRGVQALVALGLSGALEGAEALSSLRLIAGRRSASIPIPEHVSISRELLDARLASCARDAGAALLWPASARVTPGGRVKLTQGTEEAELSALVVVVADGLGGGAMVDTAGAAWNINPRGRMGAGALLEAAPMDIDRGEVVMLSERDGYLGLVGLADGRFDAAAAFDPGAVRVAGGPGNLAADFLDRAGGDGQIARAAHWKATPLLTRHRAAVEVGSIVLIGDASGYVEPFTGEGITWAIETGAEAATHAAAFARGTAQPGQWTRAHARLMDARHQRCSLIAAALRRPTVVRLAQWAMQVSPAITGALVERIGAPRRAATAASA